MQSPFFSKKVSKGPKNGWKIAPLRVKNNVVSNINFW